jgi:hypothetical protein
MRFEGDQLRTDNHLGFPSMTSQQDGCGSGSLKAQNRFDIKNAGKVNRLADALNANGRGQARRRNPSCPNQLMDRFE